MSMLVRQDAFHTSITSEGAVLSEAYAISKSGLTRVDFVFNTSERWYAEFAALEVEDLPK